MKRIQILSVLLALTLLLCACGAGPDAPAAQDPSATAGDTGSVPEQTTAPGTEAPETDTHPPIPSEPPAQRPEVVLPELGEITPAGDYAAVLAQLTTGLRAIDPALLEGGPGPGGEEIPGGGNIGAEDQGVSAGLPGMDGPERICTDGKYIYMLDSQNLTILKADGKKTGILCVVPVDREEEALLTGLFVSGKRVGVVYTCSGFDTDEKGEWIDRSSTHLAIYDTSEKSDPVKLADTAVDGSYLDARMIDGTVYLITNRYLWSPDPAAAPETVIPAVTVKGESEPIPPESLYLCPGPNNAAFTVAAALSLKDGSLRSSIAFTDAANSVFVDKDAIYLARTLWQDGVSEAYPDGAYSVVDHLSVPHTEIRRLSLGKGLHLEGSCLVEGVLTGMNGLDVRKGRLRVAASAEPLRCSVYTDPEHNWSNVRWDETERNNRVVVFDKDLQQTGAAEHLAGDRLLYSCRFLRDLCCLIPFETDAEACTVSLADPSAPVVVKGLETEAAEGSLSEFGKDRILSFSGQGTERSELRLFDSSDPESIRQVGSFTLSKDSKEAVRLDSAVFLDPETGLIGFSVDKEAETDYGYCLCRWNGKKIKQLGELRLAYLPEDAGVLLIGDLLYLCSPGVTYVTDPETAKLLTIVSNAEG